MDSGMLEVLRLLQAGPFTVATLTEVQVMLDGAKREPPDRLGGVDLAEVLALLEGFSDAAASPSVAAHAQCMMARLHLDAGARERAVECYAVALECDPKCGTAAESLVNLLKGAQGASRLAALLAARAQSLRALPDVDDDTLAQAYRSLAEVKIDLENNLDGAIAAYNQAIDYDPDVDTIEVLAGLYASRGRPGDEEQAADLYCAIGEALTGEDAIAYLESALDLMQDHAEAMERLEHLVPIEEQFVRLRDRWARYIERAGDDPDADERRVALSRAYAAQGRYRDALLCIAPAAERGMATARALREAYVANLEGEVDEGRAAAAQEIELEPSRALAARSGDTMLGIDLSEHIEDSVAAAKRKASGRAQARPVASVASGAMPVAAGVVSVPVNGPAIPSMRRMSSAPGAPPHAGAGRGGRASASVAPSGDLSSAPPASGLLQGVGARTAAVAIACTVAAVGVGLLLRTPGDDAPAASASSASAAAANAHAASAAPADKPAIAQPGSAAALATRVPPDKPAVAALAEPPLPPEPRVHMLRKAARFRGAKLSEGAFFDRVQRSLPQVVKCYEKALERDATLEGRIVYGITVKGRSATVERVSGTLEDVNLAACGRAVLRSLRYPKPATKRSAHIRLPMRFEK